LNKQAFAIQARLAHLQITEIMAIRKKVTAIHKTFGKEKRWLFYFLTLVTLLANIVDIGLLRITADDPIFYINLGSVLVMGVMLALHYKRLVPVHIAGAVVIYTLMLNFLLSMIVWKGIPNYDSHFMRISLFIWNTILITGFILDKRHIFALGGFNLLLLLMGAMTGNEFLLEQMVMIVLSIVVFCLCAYYAIGLVEKNYRKTRELAESLHEERNKIREQQVLLRQADDTKNKLFAIISHDLKSNSNLLLNFSLLLEKRVEAGQYGPASEMCRAIHQAADNNNSLLTNLLEWTRKQSGVIQFSPRLIDMSEVFAEVADDLSHSLKQKQINLDVSNSITKPVFADPVMLTSILRNLLSNAVKFSPMSASVKLNCSLASGTLVIHIADSGLGMSRDKQASLLSDGIAASTRGTSDEKGCGLGFSICKDFVERHSGRISLFSIEGKGTEVTVSIPMRQVDSL
jgi:signal transduction histidine kinase